MRPGIDMEGFRLNRPIGVTIIAVVAALNGIVLTLAGVSNLLNLKFPLLGELQVQSTGIAALIAGLIWLLLMWGFWSGGSWARMLGVIWSGLSIALGVWIIVTHLSTISAVLVPVLSAILVPLIVFWYLRTPGVKAFFAR
jgi:hypothetical protein